MLARLCVRKQDLSGIDAEHRPEFRTKLELAVDLLRWAKSRLGPLGEPPAEGRGAADGSRCGAFNWPFTTAAGTASARRCSSDSNPRRAQQARTTGLASLLNIRFCQRMLIIRSVPGTSRMGVNALVPRLPTSGKRWNCTEIATREHTGRKKTDHVDSAARHWRLSSSITRSREDVATPCPALGYASVGCLTLLLVSRSHQLNP